jgi:hypothetical protein
MPTYSSEDYERIATAIGKDVGDVVEYKQLFEWAADWYGLDRGLPRDVPASPRRTPPSKMREKLLRIAKSASRLLNDLKIQRNETKGYEEASDGPGNFELLEALAAVDPPSEDAVIKATTRLGQLATLIDAVEAAKELEDRALKAADDVIAIGKLTVPKGHEGDTPVNNWIAAMMEIYRKITGVEPATSVGHVDQANEGIASGPFIRFLQAAGRPLGLNYSEDALRSRVRTILRAHHGN